MSSVKNSAIVFITNTKRVMVLKEIKSGKWVVPGGIIDPGETPWKSALREFYEETGFKLNLKLIDEISSYVYHNHTKIYIIYSKQKFNVLKFKINNEISNIAFMKFKDFVNNSHHIKKLRSYVHNSVLYGLNKGYFNS